MKLSTLLLSSAALVVAGSAYAADLPAKKGAPAAKAATGCPAFGPGYFQIPGGDTCVRFFGHAYYSGSYSGDSNDATTASYSQKARFRFNVDAFSNTEIGVLQGYGSVNVASASTGIERAYVNFAGFTAGNQGSLADIAGTQGDQYGSKLGGGTGTGLRYDLPVGTSKLSLAVENAADNNGNAPNTLVTTPAASVAYTQGSAIVADRPDALIGFKTAFGPLSANVVFASHEAKDSRGNDGGAQGYAVVGRLGADLGGGFGVGVFGGTSEAASKYTTAGNLKKDYDGTDKAKGTNIGGQITFATGPGKLALAAAQSKETLGNASNKATYLGVSYIHTVAKGLSIEPEYVNIQTDDSATGSTNKNTFYVRIQRDF